MLALHKLLLVFQGTQGSDRHQQVEDFSTLKDGKPKCFTSCPTCLIGNSVDCLIMATKINERGTNIQIDRQTDRVID